MLPVPIESHPNNARRDGRLRPHFVTCSLGDVADYSASGMRVQFSAKKLTIGEGQVQDVTIHGVDGDFVVKAKVVWIRKRGWRKFELGLQFIGIDAKSRANLAALARAPQVGALGDQAYYAR